MVRPTLALTSGLEAHANHKMLGAGTLSPFAEESPLRRNVVEVLLASLARLIVP